MNLKRDINTIVQFTGIFTLASLGYSTVLMNTDSQERAFIDHVGADPVLFKSVVLYYGATRGMVAGLLKAIYDNLQDLQNPDVLPRPT